jgi:hypothetical protein
MISYNGNHTQVLLRVPNTPEGVDFYNHFRKYLNRGTYKLERYGRCKNRRQITKSSHPKMAQSEWFSIYIKQK